MAGTKPLLDGFRRFRAHYFEAAPALYRDRLSRGQAPRFAVVACSDSRVDPAILLQAEPGDIFTVRNVAALVPPYRDDTPCAAAAALDYAVTSLHVEHVIVIGHARCGGVAAMVRAHDGEEADGPVAAWTDQLRDARARALTADPGLAGEALLRAAERQAVCLSLDNLANYPFVRAAVTAGNLRLHGWYFDLVEGALEIWNPDRGAFERLT